MGKNADKTAEPWVDTHARRQRAWIRRNPRPHSYVQRLVWHEHHVQHVRRAPGLPLGMLHVACRPALDASCLPCAQTHVPHPCMLRRQCQNCSFNKELFSVFKYPLTTTLVQVSRRAMTGNLGWGWKATGSVTRLRPASGLGSVPSELSHTTAVYRYIPLPVYKVPSLQ